MAVMGSGHAPFQWATCDSDSRQPADLRAQLQPFQDISPQQIQEQLQQLHIKQQGDGSEEMEELGGLEQHRNSLEGSDPNVSNSRRSSTSSKASGSLIAQLLSTSPPPTLPIQSPQTHGVPTSCSSLYSQSPPPHLQDAMGRRYSDTNPPIHSAPTHNRSKRNTLPELYPATARRHHILDQRLAGHTPLPSFPVNIQPRENSPTKIFSSGSSTSSLGRRSPIHEIQMDSIAEDLTEDTVDAMACMDTRRMAKLSTPSLTGNMPCSAGRRPSLPATVNYVTDDDQRQRKSGLASILQCQVTTALNPTTTTVTSGAKTNPSANGQLLTVLQAPTFQHPQESLIRVPNAVDSQANYYTAMNHYNLAHQTIPSVILPPNFLPQPNFQQIYGQVTAVLNAYGISYYHSNGTFVVEHEGVKLRILIGNLAAQSAIQLQYVAGDAAKYENMCTQIYSHLAVQLAR